MTLLDAEELNPPFTAAQIVELEFTAASTVKMLQSDAQVVCDQIVSMFHMALQYCGGNLIGSSSIKLLSRPDPLEGRVESKRRESGDLLWKSLGHHL